MIKVIELFSGIGSQHAALTRLGIDFEIVGMAEIDKYAIKSYEAIHGKTHNYGDISKIERLGKADFWTYSFPCQDISVAGKQKGINEGTRSGLLYEVERLLEVAKEHDELPTYLMLENVKNLVGKAFKSDFDKWIGKLNELGYNTYWKVLNAKHYGVPQNRERVFAISIKKEFDMGYMFPEGFDNGIRLKDILEEEVDEKFYISGEKAEKLILKLSDANQLKEKINPCDGTINRPKAKDISNCIKARYDAGISNLKSDGTMVVEQIGNFIDTGNWNNPQRGRVYSTDGIAPTVNCVNGGGQEAKILTVGNIYPSNGQAGQINSIEGICPAVRGNGEGGMQMPKVLIPQATTKGYIECSVPGVFDMTYPDSKTRRGRVQDHGEIVPTLTAASQDIMYIEPNVLSPKRTEYGKAIRKEYEAGIIEESRHNMTTMEPRIDGICNTLTTVQKDNYVLEPTYRIRKLTPLECFRLMGFTEEQFRKAEAVNSNSQLYKQAGNSIVVDVLYHLFKNLFLESDREEYYQQLKMEG